MNLSLQVGQVAENVTVVGRGAAGRDLERHPRHRDRREEGRRPAAERPQLHAARHAHSRGGGPARGALGGATGDATPGGFGNVTGGFNVNGMRNQSNNFLLDGATQQRHLQHRLRAAAAAGRDPGVQDPHPLLHRGVRAQRGVGGERRDQVRHQRVARRAWEFNRDDALQARNFFAPDDQPKPELKQNQFGGRLGGPIAEEQAVRVRLLRGLPQHSAAPRATSVVLTEAQRARQLRRPRVIRDPLHRPALPRTTSFRPTGSSPIARQAARPTSSRCRTRGTNRYIGVADRRGRPRPVRRPARLPHQRPALRARPLPAAATSRPTPTARDLAPAGNQAKATLQDYMVGDTYMFSSQRDQRGALRLQPDRRRARRHQRPRERGPTASTCRTPTRWRWGCPPSSSPASSPLGDAQQPFVKRINEVAPVHRRVHLPRAAATPGSSASTCAASTWRSPSSTGPTATSRSTAQYTGNAGADFLLGLPAQFRQGDGDPLQDGTGWLYSVYVQDEFRLSPRLTAEPRPALRAAAAVRTRRTTRSNTFRPGVQSTRFPAAPAGLVYPGDPGDPARHVRRRTRTTSRRAWPSSGIRRATAGRACARPGASSTTRCAGQGDFFQNGVLAPPFTPLIEVNFAASSPIPHFANPLAGSPAAAPPASRRASPSSAGASDFQTPVRASLQPHRAAADRRATSASRSGYVGSRGYHLPIFIEVNPTRRS